MPIWSFFFYSGPRWLKILDLSLCSITTFNPNSIYQSNLNSLLSLLSTNATQNLEFYNTTSGQNTPNPVYSLFLCRGDVAPQLYQECVATVVKEVTKKCSREKVVVIWYDECMLRYSNWSVPPIQSGAAPP